MFELAIIVLLLLMNAFLALAELSVVSSRQARLETMAARNVVGARAALELARRPDEFLSAVQVGITLIGVLSGVYGGATFSDWLSQRIASWPVVGPHSASVAYGIIVFLLTYLSVVIGELVPKQLALSSPERFACLVAPTMRMAVKPATPVIWILSKSSELLLRLGGQVPNATPKVTEEDVNLVLAEALKSGAIAEGEQDVAERALRLADSPVTSVMTPRMDVKWLRIDEPKAVLTEKIMQGGHSHLPVCRRGVDEVLGVLLHKEAVRLMMSEGFSDDPGILREQLERLINPAVYVSASSTIAHLVDVMKGEKTHFAIVSDEYGGMAGVVTNHDLLEALVGHMAGARNEEDAIVTREDGSLLVSGWVNLDEVYRALNLEPTTGAVNRSVAFHVISALNRIPQTGDHVQLDGIRFEIVDKDGSRVDRLMVSRVGTAEDAG